jgi:hypothetical protein
LRVKRDHNEGVERDTALQWALMCVNTQGLSAILNLPLPVEGSVHEKISPSTSGGSLLSGERIV